WLPSRYGAAGLSAGKVGLRAPEGHRVDITVPPRTMTVKAWSHESCFRWGALVIRSAARRRELLMSKGRLLSRRALIASAVAAGATPAFDLGSIAAPRAAEGDAWLGLKVGVATYTLRKLPLDAAIKAVQRVGVRYVSIKDVHMARKTTAEE